MIISCSFQSMNSNMAKRSMLCLKQNWINQFPVEAIYTCSMHHGGGREPFYCLNCCTEGFSFYLNWKLHILLLFLAVCTKIMKRDRKIWLFFHSKLYFAEKPLKFNVQMAVADSLQEVYECNGTKQWCFSF